MVFLQQFIHGEIMMFGAYFAFIAATTLNWPFWAVIAFSMILTAVMGVVIEFIAYRPLRNAPRLSALITAIGVSMFLQNLALMIFGADPKVMPKIFPQVVFHVGGLEINSITLITIGLSVLFMILLELFIQKTKQGRAMRAVSENQNAAFCAFYDLIGIIYTEDETGPCHARRFRKSECRYFNGN